MMEVQRFLSTPSARRATQQPTAILCRLLFLSTPSARRATYDVWLAAYRSKFLSTPSARRATSKSQAVTETKLISIHALREEGDRLD